jgi:acetoacetyl-CoA synthetase
MEVKMSGKLLWQPKEEAVVASNMYRFMETVNRQYGTEFKEYKELHEWSVNNLSEFWAELWKFVDVKASVPYSQVIDDPTRMPGAKWFEGSELNFAENLLRYRDDRDAIVFCGEGKKAVKLTYAQLYDEVARLARSLRDMGVVAGDRVAGFVPNMPQTIIAMLAATSIGAIWSSSSPDFGLRGVLDRFGQIKPKVLFAANGYSFKGRNIDSLGPVKDIVEQLDSVQKVVIIPYTQENADISNIPNSVHYSDFLSDTDNLEIEFAQLPFDHPLYIMYSSGTTGLPKCLVQSTGGILVHHLKELVLHTNLRRDDNIFYFTTCGWMMWNWLTTSLAVGATVVLFDGNPFYPDPNALWQMAQEEKVTVFGTSAGYLAALEKAGAHPGRDYDLSSVRAVLSTGSPLSEEGFEFVYREIKEDVQLASIAGGTDLNGCFALGNPMLPVYAGELQCRGLAMDVHAFGEDGKPVVGQQAELVCTAPFPSMPIYFWDDQDGKKYHNAYFDVYPGIWRHGDFVEVTKRGGVVFCGRSDATLNPGGVRIGTSDIYSVVEKLDEIADSLVIGQSWKNDVRVILFVVIEGAGELTPELQKKIVQTIRSEASPRHVPAKIIQVGDVPYTLNNKKVELAVKKVVEGKAVLNKDALRNPESLDMYKDIPSLNED